MDEFVENIDATPEKRSFFSIVNDYDIKLSLCELIDNSIDFWKQNDSTEKLEIQIRLDSRQQSIYLSDNAGGVNSKDMRLLVSPGASSNSEYDETIGIFGVGSKRAIVALSFNTKIISRERKSKYTYLVEITNDWLQEDSWKLPLRKTSQIEIGKTEIHLFNLRQQINDETETELRDYLSRTYAKFIMDQNINIELNGDGIEPILFDQEWTYPTDYCPTSFKMNFLIDDNRAIKSKITGGLIQEGCAGEGEHGVYLYCNNRLIVRGERTPEVGYIVRNAGSPDHLNIIRVIIEMHGAAKFMPWDSSKSRFNYHNESFKLIQKKIIELVTYWVKVSRSFERSEGGWRQHVFPYTNGEISETTLDVEAVSINRYLMPIKASKPKLINRIKQLNKEIAQNKHYTKGLYETIISYDAIKKLDISQKNRILLILLDSSLEIAFKEFLIYEVAEGYGDARLQKIFKNRRAVHDEIQKHIELEENIWNNINWFYNQRCDLIHKKASTGVNDEEIEDFKEIIELVFNKLFGLKFK